MSLIERLQDLIERLGGMTLSEETEDELHYILNSFEQQLEEE